MEEEIVNQDQAAEPQATDTNPDTGTGKEDGGQSGQQSQQQSQQQSDNQRIADYLFPKKNVDQSGQPQAEEAKANDTDQQQQEPAPQQPEQPQGLDALVYDENGQLNPDAYQALTEPGKDFKYEVPEDYKPEEAKEQKPLHVQLREERDQYRDGLAKNLRQPLESAAQLLQQYSQQSGEQIPQFVVQALQQAAAGIDQQVQDEYRRMEAEHQDRIFSEMQSGPVKQAERQQMQTAANANVANLHSKLGNGDMQRGATAFNHLVWGEHGLPIVSMMYNLQTGKHVTNNPGNDPDFAEWWYQTAADKQRLDNIVSLASSKFHLANQDRLRDAYKAKWEQERRTSVEGRQNHNAGMQPATKGGTPDALDRFFTPPSRR